MIPEPKKEKPMANLEINNEIKPANGYCKVCKTKVIRFDEMPVRFEYPSDSKLGMEHDEYEGGKFKGRKYHIFRCGGCSEVIDTTWMADGASTHWIHADTEMDSLPESLQYSPEDAADQYLSDADFATTSWEDRDELLSEGHVDIKFIGLMETTELITEEEQQFYEYEPGQTWYKKTGEKATVRVSLKFEVIDSTVEKFGGVE